MPKQTKAERRAYNRAWRARKLKEDPTYFKSKAREYYINNRQKHLDVQLKNAYGITRQEWQDLLDRQNGVCAICGGSGETKGRRSTLYVDHCHGTQRIRKLLCHSCNMGLGIFKDNPEWLRNAAQYLECHSA